MCLSIISSEDRIPYKYFYRYSQTDLQIYVKSSMQTPCTFFVFPINNVVNHEQQSLSRKIKRFMLIK